MKHYRLLYIIPTTSIATVLFFAYRYMWFGLETVPPDRIFVAFFISGVASSFLFLKEIN